jgi:hypothetical protein
MPRSPQQKIGDRLEQAVLKETKEWYPDADLTRGSGSTHGDGDIRGVPDLHIECKNSDKPGKGRSISKKDWLKIKSQADRRHNCPAHVGFDDDEELVVLVRYRDLLAYHYHLEDWRKDARRGAGGRQQPGSEEDAG